MFKSAFRKYRTNNRYFNLPKFHVITHYPEFIDMYGTADRVDTSWNCEWCLPNVIQLQTYDADILPWETAYA
jgi:hypothetical protein